ncbi:MAG TPA: hypothetical protein VFY25_00385 [Anaerolineales bacterium]|nr:hypothetical protein [Anaerolineales bacterium]
MKHKSMLLTLLTVFVLSCGTVQQTVQMTATPAFTSTPTLTATPAPTSTPRPTRTKTPDIVATRQAEKFTELMQSYFSFGSVETLEGKYYSLDDYVSNLARKGYFEWAAYDLKVRNFILRTKVRMSTANNPSTSTGCGIVFRTVGDFAETIFVQQSGELNYGAGSKNFHFGYLTKFSNPAEFELVVVVNENNYQVFIDGETALKGDSMLDPGSGGIGFAVQSGSDEDFGSQCNFTENDLWAIKKR